MPLGAQRAESSIQPDAAGLTVFFDGSCPMCRREVGVYQGLNASCPIDWLDVSSPEALPVDATTRARYMARFHVRQADGQLLSGAAAFVALWRRLPGWRWLARLASLPGVTPLLEWMYRGFLPLRPSLQAWVRALETPHVPAEMVADLRSDHAGETGAVWIYRGILAVTRDPALRSFAHHHLATEQRHLDDICAVLPPARRSWLLLPWRCAGFLTGAMPALAGPRAVYATIHAVETFVDGHYQHQLDRIDALAATQPHPALAPLRALLYRCQQDECQHRDEALALQGVPAGWPVRAWCRLVGAGSQLAVHLARRL